jgi:hypothetical protein
VPRLTRAAHWPGEAQPGALGREAEELLLRQHLKRHHAASILSLKEEFMRKRKSSKLPNDSITSLKTWWTSNFVWPYPSVRAPRSTCERA